MSTDREFREIIAAGYTPTETRRAYRRSRWANYRWALYPTGVLLAVVVIAMLLALGAQALG